MTPPPSPTRTWLPTIGAVLALLGVAAGAFGAHALDGVVTPRRLATWHTAADYQLWHALALIGAGLLAERTGLRALRVAAVAFLFGIVVFSGSLYLLVAIDVAALGAVTPLGGVAFMIGWIAAAIGLRPSAARR